MQLLIGTTHIMLPLFVFNTPNGIIRGKWQLDQNFQLTCSFEKKKRQTGLVLNLIPGFFWKGKRARVVPWFLFHIAPCTEWLLSFCFVDQLPHWLVIFSKQLGFWSFPILWYLLCSKQAKKPPESIWIVSETKAPKRFGKKCFTFIYQQTAVSSFCLRTGFSMQGKAFPLVHFGRMPKSGPIDACFCVTHWRWQSVGQKRGDNRLEAVQWHPRNSNLLVSQPRAVQSKLKKSFPLKMEKKTNI